MKIAIMLDTLDVGGAERQAILCVSELRKLGHSADLIHYHPSVEYGQMLAQLNVKPIYVAGAGFAQRCRRLRRLFKERRYDVVHGFKMAAEVYAAVAGTWAGVPRRFGSFRNIYNLGFKYRLLHYVVDKGLDGWIVNSKVGAESMAKHARISARKIVILRNALCQEVFATPIERGRAKARLGFSEVSIIVTIVARLEPVKNHRMFIDAAALALQQIPHARFLVVGKGSLDRLLKDYAAQQHIADRVQFLGERSDIAEILAATDISALTSDYEGLPNVIVEAMAAARPIVCTNYKGHEEIMTADVNALISPCRNAPAFAENLVRLIKDRGLRDKLSNSAREYARKHFSPGPMARELERIYLSHQSSTGGNGH